MDRVNFSSSGYQRGLVFHALGWCLITLLTGAVPWSPVWAQAIRSVHCLQDCPEGAEPDNHLILRSIYALSYDVDLGTAVWVAYRVEAATLGVASSLPRELLADPAPIPTRSPQSFALAEQSGLITERYVPLVTFAGTPYWQDVNYVSNAVLRTRTLNSGAWNGLDWAIRNLASRGRDLHVLTGPILESEPAHAAKPDLEPPIPVGFYKIVATETGDFAAFLLPQSASVGIHHCSLLSSIETLQQLTGLDFFPGQSPTLSDALVRELGCP